MMMTPMRWINLTKRPTCSDLQWKHPTKADFVNWKPESIVECDIDGEWDVSKTAIFHLHVKTCIHLAVLGINEKTFANVSWHICCILFINLLIPEGNKRPYILRKT